MPTSVRSHRPRHLAIAVGLVSSLALAGAPASAAEDDGPQSVVRGLFADVTAGDFAALPGWFCDEFADQAATLDPSVLLADFPPGIDSESVLRAFPVQIRIESMETLSESDTEAVVRIDADLDTSVDGTLLEPIIVALLEAGGQEADERTVEGIIDGLASQIDRTQDISGEIKVVPRDDGNWGLVCSPVRDQAGAGTGDSDGSSE